MTRKDCAASAPYTASDLAIGSRVQVIGLQSKPEFNGTFGVVVALEKDSKRLGVRIDGEQTSKSFKCENLVQVFDMARRSPRQQRKMLCRYGQACWRQCCFFRHEHEKERAQQNADYWVTELARISGNEPVFSTSSLAQKLEQVETKMQTTMKMLDSMENEANAKLERLVEHHVKEYAVGAKVPSSVCAVHNRLD